MLNQV
jgi:hypothetical protein